MDASQPLPDEAMKAVEAEKVFETHEIPELITHISGSLDAIEMIAQSLEAKLEPVMEQTEVRASGDVPREARKTTYGSQLDSISYRLDRIGNQLIQITTRLEV